MQPTEEAAVLPGRIHALPVIITVVVVVIVTFNLLHETGDRDGCGDGNHRLRADDHDEVDQPPQRSGLQSAVDRSQWPVIPL